MTSVSNAAVGAYLAGNAAAKARQGLNEAIARLSNGVRAMYGGDAAGHSIGTVASAEAKSYAAATRNIEDGISYAHTGESVLLEIANLGTRLRELGIQADIAALHDANQIAAYDAEATLIGDTIDNILDTTDFNTIEVVDKAAAKQVAINYVGEASGTSTNVGPNKSITAVNPSAAAGADGTEYVLKRMLAQTAETLALVQKDSPSLVEGRSFWCSSHLCGV